MNKDQKKLLISIPIFIFASLLGNILLALLMGDDVLDKFITGIGGAVGILIVGVLYYFGFRTVKPKDEKESK